MKNDSKKTDTNKSEEMVIVIDFAEMGRITKENLDSVFDNDLTALARRRREKRFRE